MRAQQPTLSYGIEPAPGSVVYRESADGSVQIEVTPKSPAQVWPLIAWGAACLLVPLAAVAWFWSRGRVEGWFVLVGAFVTLHLLIAIPVILYRTGRHRLHVAAGPQGLSVSTTQLGDPVHHDWDRAAIEDVYITAGDEGEALNSFSVRLRGKAEPVVVPVYRDARSIEQIVRRIRSAVGLG